MLYKLLSIAKTVFVNSEPNFNDVDQKISKESNTNNYSDWNTSDSNSGKLFFPLCLSDNFLKMFQAFFLKLSCVPL